MEPEYREDGKVRIIELRKDIYTYEKVRTHTTYTDNRTLGRP